MSVRLANEGDSERFARWIADSDDIPSSDVTATFKENNPTSVTLVIEEDGTPILFAPTYAIALLGFLGFNPEADAKQRVRALEQIKVAAQAFWGMYGVTSIATLSMKDYAVAKWALKHDFKLDPRQVFVLTSKPNTEKEPDVFICRPH